MTQLSVLPGRQQNASTKPAAMLDDALEEGIQSAKRSRPLRILFPRMERDCPPASERFWAIGGRPGNFKTQLMWNMALNMAESRHRVLFVSLEMTPGELSLQAVARYSRIGVNRILAANRAQDSVPFGPADQACWDAAVNRFMSLGMYLRVHGADQCGRDLRDVMSNATRHAYDAVFLDHLGMIGRDTGGNELEKLAEATHALRALSRGEVASHCRPFVCASSPLNRDIEKGQEDEQRIPRLADFRGSSRIEHDTDVAMVLQKRRSGEDDPTSIVDAFVLKNRQGKCPLVLQFEAQGAIAFVTERRRQEEPPRRPYQDREED